MMITQPCHVCLLVYKVLEIILKSYTAMLRCYSYWGWHDLRSCHRLYCTSSFSSNSMMPTVRAVVGRCMPVSCQGTGETVLWCVCCQQHVRPSHSSTLTVNRSCFLSPKIFQNGSWFNSSVHEVHDFLSQGNPSCNWDCRCWFIGWDDHSWH